MAEEARRRLGLWTDAETFIDCVLGLANADFTNIHQQLSPSDIANAINDILKLQDFVLDLRDQLRVEMTKSASCGPPAAGSVGPLSLLWIGLTRGFLAVLEHARPVALPVHQFASVRRRFAQTMEVELATKALHVIPRGFF